MPNVTDEDSIKDIKMQVVEHLQEMVTDASDAVDEIQNVYDVLKDAAEEYAQTNGYISVDAFQKIVELGPQYMQYLRDENGLLVINEESIKRVIAAKTEQLALENAMSYVEQLRIALLDQNTLALNNLLYATTAATDATWGLVYASLATLNLNGDQLNAAYHNIDALRAMAENAMAGIFQPSADELQDINDDLVEKLEDMRDGASDIIDYVMDMLEDRVEEQIDKLEELKDTYAEIIDLKKESLEATRDENDYNDQLADKVEEIAELQSKINLLSMDDSRSAQIQRNELMEQLQQAQEELADMQADEAYKQQTDSLDKMQEAYEDQKDDEISKLEETISSTEKLYQMAIRYIRENWSTLLDELKQWNWEMGTSLERDIVEAWNNALAAAERYGQYISQDLIDAIQAEIDSINSISSSVTGSTVVGPSQDYDHSYADAEAVKARVMQMRQLSAAWNNFGSAADNEKLHNQAAELAASLAQFGVTVRYDSASGVWYIASDRINPSNAGKKLYDVYHSGGIAGNVGTPRENETLALLEKGEPVISNSGKNALYRMIDFISVLKDKMRGFTADGASTPLAAVLDGAGAQGYRNISTTNNSPNIHFGDVYITGQGDDAVEKYRAVTRQFTNEVLSKLNIKR